MLSFLIFEYGNKSPIIVVILAFFHHYFVIFSIDPVHILLVYTKILHFGGAIVNDNCFKILVFICC